MFPGPMTLCASHATSTLKLLRPYHLKWHPAPEVSADIFPIGKRSTRTWQNSFITDSTAPNCFWPVESLTSLTTLKEWSSFRNMPHRASSQPKLHVPAHASRGQYASATAITDHWAQHCSGLALPRQIHAAACMHSSSMHALCAEMQLLSVELSYDSQ
jgi:hypothetical protein